MKIKIDGELLEVESVNDYGYIYIEADGMEYTIFKSREIAGQETRDYWEDMAKNDPDEFACMVGKDALIAWCLGQNYAPGSIGVSSLQEWLDLTADYPEEHFAGYDGAECTINYMSRDLLRELGDDHDWLDALRSGNAVAYRNN